MVRSMVMVLGALTLPAGTAAVAQQGGGASKPLTRSEFVSKLDGTFSLDDTNKDGFLSTSELETAQNRELQQLRSIQMSRAQAEFKQLDTNKDGRLSVEEFAAILPQVKANETPAEFLQKLDSNKDGKVSADEFKAPRMALFQRLDANHDGTVTPDEAKAAAGGR